MYVPDRVRARFAGALGAGTENIDGLEARLHREASPTVRSLRSCAVLIAALPSPPTSLLARPVNVTGVEPATVAPGEESGPVFLTTAQASSARARLLQRQTRAYSEIVRFVRLHAGDVVRLGHFVVALWVPPEQGITPRSPDPSEAVTKAGEPSLRKRLSTFLSPGPVNEVSEPSDSVACDRAIACALDLTAFACLGMRIGVATGRVWEAFVRSQAESDDLRHDDPLREYVVFGCAVHAAFRCLRNAAAGQVVLSDGARRIISSRLRDKLLISRVGALGQISQVPSCTVDPDQVVCYKVPQSASLSPSDLRVLRAMSTPGGVVREDRRYNARLYRNCFVGSEAVSFIVGFCNVARDEAVEVGHRLLRSGAIDHVTSEQDFQDDEFFYVFSKQWQPSHFATSSPVKERSTIDRALATPGRATTTASTCFESSDPSFDVPESVAVALTSYLSIFGVARISAEFQSSISCGLVSQSLSILTVLVPFSTPGAQGIDTELDPIDTLTGLCAIMDSVHSYVTCTSDVRMVPMRVSVTELGYLAQIAFGGAHDETREHHAVLAVKSAADWVCRSYFGSEFGTMHCRKIVAGVATGTCLTGFIGDELRSEFAVLGEAVERSHSLGLAAARKRDEAVDSGSPRPRVWCDRATRDSVGNACSLDIEFDGDLIASSVLAVDSILTGYGIKPHSCLDLEYAGTTVAKCARASQCDLSDFRRSLSGLVRCRGCGICAHAECMFKLHSVLPGSIKPRLDN